MSDLISRQAAIDYFVTNVGYHDEDGYPIEDSDELRKIWTEYFGGIPSAQPDRKDDVWNMFELITSVYYGKQYYFMQDDGLVYSRASHKYMAEDAAIEEFLGAIGQ